MTTTPGYEWPQNDPLFDLSLDMVAEGVGGNGVLTEGDLNVTTTANANEIQVAAGEVFYDGTVYSEGAASTFTLSSNTAGDDRWDLVYYDTGVSAPAVREGTPSTTPEPPLLQAGEFGIAYVYVADGQTDVTDSEVKNWQSLGDRADATYLADAAGDYNSDTVEGALGEISDDYVDESGDTMTGQLDISSGGLLVSGGGATVSAGDLTASGGDITDGTNVVYDLSATEVPQGRLGGPAASLSSYPLPIGDLNSPFSLSSITDMDVAGSDLVDGATTLYDATAGEFVQSELGGPASSLSSYPLPIADLNSPFSLSSISDMDVAGTDLLDSAGPGVIYDAAAGVVLQNVLGGPASSLSSYPLPLGDLASPYALPSISDMDVAGTNLVDGATTLYDATAGEFPRGVLDDELATTTVTSSTYSSADDELILVDTATVAASSTITLSSSDGETGSTVVVADVSGSASTYTITVETEGTETINGESSATLSTDYAARTFSSDGSNWITTNASELDASVQVEGAESGVVAAGEQGTLIFDHLQDGETLEIYKAIFTLDDGTAVPTGLDLIIATLDNSGGYTLRTTIYSGDGTTIWDGDAANSIGEPLASYTNGTGSGTTVAVLADNGSGSQQSIMTKATGERIP